MQVFCTVEVTRQFRKRRKLDSTHLGVIGLLADCCNWKHLRSQTQTKALGVNDKKKKRRCDALDCEVSLYLPQKQQTLHCFICFGECAVTGWWRNLHLSPPTLCHRRNAFLCSDSNPKQYLSCQSNCHAVTQSSTFT